MKELCISLNSASRTPGTDVNGCTLDIPEMPTTQTHQVSLGSFEMPLSQATVEPDWNEFYFHNGIWFISDADRILGYYDSTSGSLEEVILPLRTNGIVSITGPGINNLSSSAPPIVESTEMNEQADQPDQPDQPMQPHRPELIMSTDGTCRYINEGDGGYLVGNTQQEPTTATYTFQTETPHGLRNVISGQTMELIQFGQRDYKLKNIFIISSTEFTADMEEITTMDIPDALNIKGYLYVSEFKTISDLLKATGLAFTFDKHGILGCRTEIDPGTTMAKKLGYTMRGKNAFLHNSFFSKTKLDTGNYNVSNLTTSSIISLCPSRLALVSSETGSLEMEVTSHKGITITVNILSNNSSITSICTPDSIVNVISNLLNSNGTQSLLQMPSSLQLFDVSIVETPDEKSTTHGVLGKYIQYKISNEKPFEIRFSPGLARILNMKTNNTNSNEYISEKIWVPLDHNGNYTRVLWNSFSQSPVAYDSHLELVQRSKSMFKVFLFNNDSNAADYYETSGEYYLTTGSYDSNGVLDGYLHELTSGDILTINEQKFVVDRVNTHLAFYIKKTTTDIPFYNGSSWDSKMVFLQKPQTEFDFISRGGHENNPLAEILGFPEDRLFYGGTYVRSPNAMNVDHPPYLLVDINFDNKSQTTRDTYRNSSKTIFAKLQTIVSGSYSRELRVYAMNNTFMAPRDIKNITINVYNPNHSRYNFHGKNFSLTLNFAAPFLAGAQLQAT